MSVRESESMLRPEDIVRGLRGDARKEQPPRVDLEHPVHRIDVCYVMDRCSPIVSVVSSKIKGRSTCTDVWCYVMRKNTVAHSSM